MDLNSVFIGTSRVLFGREIGGLAQFEPYLAETSQRQRTLGKSSISGKEVHFSRPYYAKGAKCAGLDEINEGKAALGMNDIKDIDSLLAALSEQMYCGNKNIGMNANVQKSDTCTDCQDLLDCGQMLSCRQVAHSYAIREGEALFGCNWCGETSFGMRSGGMFFSKRCFESYLGVKCFDTYFCMNMRSCSDCLFSFNQVSKNRMIGNRALPKEKYDALKKKLLGEIAEGLAAGKRYPSLFELVEGG